MGEEKLKRFKRRVLSSNWRKKGIKGIGGSFFSPFQHSTLFLEASIHFPFSRCNYLDSQLVRGSLPEEPALSSLLNTDVVPWTDVLLAVHPHLPPRKHPQLLSQRV